MVTPSFVESVSRETDVTDRGIAERKGFNVATRCRREAAVSPRTLTSHKTGLA
jgi:hypothetical protein